MSSEILTHNCDKMCKIKQEKSQHLENKQISLRQFNVNTNSIFPGKCKDCKWLCRVIPEKGWSKYREEDISTTWYMQTLFSGYAKVIIIFIKRQTSGENEVW